MAVKLTQVVIDCADPERLATFWCEVLGWKVVDRDEDEIEIGGTGDGPTLLMDHAPDAKVGKNRLHLDLTPNGDQQAEVDRIIALGAQRVDIGQGDVTWVVLADPEGNEFCVLRGSA
jgi:catechol 2,3-dioxygenase-like lactoylglutathione lyase family enzyme